jgi:hypothetical protein
MTGDPYPTILSQGFGVPLSMFLNFGAPLAAHQISRRLERLKWWSHVVAFFWQIISIFVFAILLLPAVPADEAPGPGDGFLLFPTLLSVAVVLFGYCIVLIWKFFALLARP